MGETTYINFFAIAASWRMFPRCAIIAIAILLAMVPALADDKNPWNINDKYPWKYDKSILQEASAWLKTKEFTYMMSVAPVMRTIVCRVPFINFTVDALATATGLTPDRLMFSVNKLVSMDLLVLAKDGNGNTFIIPKSQQARHFMRSWSDDWCTGDDQCGAAP